MRTRLTLLSLFFVIIATAQSYNDFCRQGLESIKQNQFDEASLCFEKAVAQSSNDREKIYALANLAYSHQVSGNLVKALDSYDKALKIAPEEITLMQQRANIYLQLDSTELALKDYNTILQHEPSNTGALLCRAHIHTDNGTFEKAWRDYNELQRWLPDNLSVQLGIATLYQKEKRYDESMMIMTGLIEANPNIAELYIARSNLERERGYNELAIMDIEKAIELDPENANHFILLSIIYEKMGKKDAAKKSREKATLLEGGCVFGYLRQTNAFSFGKNFNKIVLFIKFGCTFGKTLKQPI